MTSIGIWAISEMGPRRITSSNINLESQLEDWIERDPSLLEAGLTIIGRQVRVDGGPLDLLAIDSQGSLVVIELKRGTLYRETFAQALDYAASIATMPSSRIAAIAKDYVSRRSSELPQGLAAVVGPVEGSDSSTYRDVRIILVGTESDQGLHRITTYLANAYNIPTTVVTYQVFEFGDDQRILLRELTDADTATPVLEKKPRATVEAVCALADDHGVGSIFRRILTTAQQLGLYPRPYPLCVMYTSATNRSRGLFTVWTNPEQSGTLRMWLQTDAFPEFFTITLPEVEQHLGESGWRTLSPDDVEEFVQRLTSLFSVIENASEHQVS